MNCIRLPNSCNAVGTPDPHYIPGYTGYVPQEKFRPSNTYGMGSHRILMDPCIHMSPRSILNDIHPQKCTKGSIDTDPFLSSQMARANGQGNLGLTQQYQPNMAPRYDGFVPRFQSILGHTNSPACNRALSRVDQDLFRDKLFTKELEALDGWRSCYKTKAWERNEKSQSGNGCGCSGEGPSGAVVMTTPADPLGSACGNPAASNILSSGRSVCEYAQRRMWGAANESLMSTTCRDAFPKNSSLSKGPVMIDRVQQIYRHCDGMLPNYQGHVPGEQFRIGVTYGTATRNPLRVIQPLLNRPLCYPLRK